MLRDLPYYFYYREQILRALSFSARGIIASSLGALACVAILGCSSVPKISVAQDLTRYPQDALFYVDSALESTLDSRPDSALESRANVARSWNDEAIKKRKSLAQAYLQGHFSPWSKNPNPNPNEVFWMLGALRKSPGFSENRLPHSSEFIQALIESMDIAHYPSAKQKAIITTPCDVRAVPTKSPRFDSADDYPFDQWQNSWLFMGTPVLITHYDTSRQWAHVESGFVSGWVQAENLATISDTQAKQLMQASYIAPKRDYIPLRERQSHALIGAARIGQILPISAVPKSGWSVLVALRDEQGRAKLVESSASMQDFYELPRDFTQKQAAALINEMIGDKYGWGGYLGSRDCSAFIRDIFANFALYLPRNSRAQANAKKSMQDLSKLRRRAKEREIIERGIPFASVLYLKGHIMLYIGEYQGRAMVAHSAWSVKPTTLFRKHRSMLGGVVITSLYAGKEHSGVFSRKLLIDRVTGMTNLLELMEIVSEEASK